MALLRRLWDRVPGAARIGGRGGGWRWWWRWARRRAPPQPRAMPATCARTRSASWIATGSARYRRRRSQRSSAPICAPRAPSASRITGITSATTSRRFSSSPTRHGSATTSPWSSRSRSARAAPHGARPGQDVTHGFELSVAPWFSMALCDPISDPHCRASRESDANAATARARAAAGGVRGVAVLPAGVGAVQRQHQLQQHRLVLGAHIDGLECDAAGTATTTASSRSTSRSSRGTASRPGRRARSCVEPGDVHAEREDPADEPGRQDRHSHVRCQGGGRPRARDPRDRPHQRAAAGS